MRYFAVFLMVLLVASAASGLDLLDGVTDCLFAHECHDGGGQSAPVPEPGAALAFAAGLIALGIGRKRSSKR